MAQTESTTPSLIRGPLIEVRSHTFDSARWAGYRPRFDDIIISTYPKCGTTWMQRIVCMLVFKSAEPKSLHHVSPWLDMRTRFTAEEILAHAETQTHRRFLKSHLPYDALPVYEGVKFIHVARDGRDAALSYYNHYASYTPAAIERHNTVTLADPKFRQAFLPMTKDAAGFFHDWVLDGGAKGDEKASFFHIEKSFWAARRDPNVLLVHYNDLKKDLGGEMRRIARFLAIEVPEAVWPSLIEGASFEAMRQQGDKLMPQAQLTWGGGTNTFLHSGSNNRWRGVAASEDLELYDATVEREFSPELARWVEHGRLVAGDP
jgi:aryl sulfotransferase